MRFGVSGPEKTGFTMNVSLSGTYIKTNTVFKPGTMIQLEFDFPGEKQSVWAQVIWARRVPPELAHVLPCGMGVRFINPGPDWERAFKVWDKG